MLPANPYFLSQGHSFMFCQPTVNQFAIKALPNSALIPTSSSCFPLTLSEVLVLLPHLLSDLLRSFQHVMPDQTQPVKITNKTCKSVQRTCHITQRCCCCCMWFPLSYLLRLDCLWSNLQSWTFIKTQDLFRMLVLYVCHFCSWEWSKPWNLVKCVIK